MSLYSLDFELQEKCESYDRKFEQVISMLEVLAGKNFNGKFEQIREMIEDLHRKIDSQNSSSTSAITEKVKGFFSESEEE